MKNVKDETRKQTILKVYGSIGKGTTRTCCGNSDPEIIAKQLGYTGDQIDGIPPGANLGLGCGNPHSIASFNNGEIVLDLGSGAGFDSLIAAREVGEYGKVIGVDMTPEMIEKANDNARKANIKNVEFLYGQIENLPLPDESVDVVISNCVVNLSEDKQKVYDEVFRVLRVGGRLAISDILTRRPLPKKIREDAQLIAGCVGGAITSSELYQILEKARFSEISVLPKNNSNEVISEWDSEYNIEAYLFSAYISAIKPGSIK